MKKKKELHIQLTENRCVMQSLHYKWIRDPIKCMCNRSLFATHHSSSASLLSEIESLPPKNDQRPLHTWPGWSAYSLHITKNMFSTQHLPTELRMNLEQLNCGVILYVCSPLILRRSPASCSFSLSFMSSFSTSSVLGFSSSSQIRLQRQMSGDMKAVVTSYNFIWNYPAKTD